MRLISLLISVLLGVLHAQAEVVKYIDENNRTHYVESLERVPEQFREQASHAPPLPKINKVPGSPLVAGPIRSGSGAGKKRHKVEIFVADWCPHCRALEKHLKSQNISYTRYDVEHNSRGIKEYQALGGGGIPIIRIDGSNVLRGFDPSALSAALN